MIKICQADFTDAEEVLGLLREYHIDYISDENKPDGFVTTNITEEQLCELIAKEKGVTVAKDEGKVIAFALAASWQFWSQWPFFSHMIGQLQKFSYGGEMLTTKNSYQYGPICVDKAYRGKGVFEKVFYESLKSMAQRYPIMVTFINKINNRSFAAHTRKVKLETVGTFDYNSNNYYALACETKSGDIK